MKKPRPKPKADVSLPKTNLQVSPGLRAPLSLLDEVAEILAVHVPEAEVEAALISLAVFAELHPDMRERLRFLMARDVGESGPVGEVDATAVSGEPARAAPGPRTARPSEDAAQAANRGRASGRKR